MSQTVLVIEDLGQDDFVERWIASHAPESTCCI